MRDGAEVLGVASYSELFGATSVLGQWLRTLPAVLKVNDLLCLHAGISRALVDSGLTPTRDQRGRAFVARGRRARGRARSWRAPTCSWAGGATVVSRLFRRADRLSDRHEGRRRPRARARSACAGSSIGHTIVPTVTPLYDGKVIAVQVYPKRDGAGRTSFESLVVKKDGFFRAKLDGTLETVGAGGSAQALNRGER